MTSKIVENKKLIIDSDYIALITNCNDPQYKTEEWRIELKEEIQIVLQTKRIKIAPDQIKEFRYLVVPIPMSHWNPRNQAIAFYFKYNSNKPYELFRITSSGEMKNPIDEPITELCELTLSKLKEVYKIDHSYDSEILVKQNTPIILAIIIALTLLLILWLIVGK